MDAKLDLIRGAITSLKNMTDEYYYESNYFNIISQGGGPYFIEAIGVSRKPSFRTEMTFDDQGNPISEVEVEIPPDPVPTRQECLNYMENSLIMILLVAFSLQ